MKGEIMNTETVHNGVLFPNVKVGETFKVGEYEFIRFPEVDGKTPVVMKDFPFSTIFGNNNDLRCSKVIKRMEKEILPKIVATVGEENVLMFKTDLTALDGLKPYEPLESKISLPTMDFYRANVEIFDKYNPGRWWWLATPESAQPHYAPDWILCVSPSGDIVNRNFNGVSGVRPFCVFPSSIFGSFEA